jgi:hypothetical protein
MFTRQIIGWMDAKHDPSIQLIVAESLRAPARDRPDRPNQNGGSALANAAATSASVATCAG